MKRMLLLLSSLLLIASVAMADYIGVYKDNKGDSCLLAPGFTSSAAIIHKFATGATSSRFKAAFPAGSSFFTFSTPYTAVGNLLIDLSLGYGQCLSGHIVLGNIVATLTPGTLQILPPDGFATAFYSDCSFGELPTLGGSAYVGGSIDQCAVPAHPSTWGSVKALYR